MFCTLGVLSIGDAQLNMKRTNVHVLSFKRGVIRHVLYFRCFEYRGYVPFRVTRSLVLCVWFVDRCLSICTFSFRRCVVFFNIRILITPLVSSNSS